MDLAPLAHAHEREEALLARPPQSCPVPLRSASLANSHSRRMPTKSERSSRKRRCRSSAFCCASRGRSRGSWTLSAAATTSTSRRHPSSAPARIMRPMRGSTGNRARRATERRELALLVERAELLEHAVALGDRLRLRRVEERKVLDVAEPERLHPQDDAGEPGALDLRIGERRARREALLVVEAHADAVADAPAAALALIGARLRDRPRSAGASCRSADRSERGARRPASTT